MARVLHRITYTLFAVSKLIPTFGHPRKKQHKFVGNPMQFAMPWAAFTRYHRTGCGCTATWNVYPTGSRNWDSRPCHSATRIHDNPSSTHLTVPYFFVPMAGLKNLKWKTISATQTRREGQHKKKIQNKGSTKIKLLSGKAEKMREPKLKSQQKLNHRNKVQNIYVCVQFCVVGDFK